METGNTLYYSDGQRVTVSNNGFKVRNTLYQLSAIKRHTVSIISPTRIPYTSVMIIGIIISACGEMNFLPTAWASSIRIFGFTILANVVVIVSGFIFFVVGLIAMWRSKEKYAVRILTSEGEKIVVVSQSREYISKIIDALNHAFLDLLKKK